MIVFDIYNNLSATYKPFFICKTSFCFTKEKPIEAKPDAEKCPDGKPKSKDGKCPSNGKSECIQNCFTLHERVEKWSYPWTLARDALFIT